MLSASQLLSAPRSASALLVASLLAVASTASVAAPPRTGKPEAGRLLVARETLLDPNFVHAVVILLEADSQGAVGLVVNRPTQMPVERVLPGAETVHDPVWIGGPVEPERVFVLVRSDEALPETVPLIDGVRLGGTIGLLSAAAESGTAFRVLSGYAGWVPGQLEREVGLGSWYVVDADAAHVFADDPEALWRNLRDRASAPWARRESTPDREPALLASR